MDLGQSFGQFHYGIIILFYRRSAITGENRNSVVNIVVKGQLLTFKVEIPVRCIGVVNLIGETDSQLIYQNIGDLVEFVESAVFSYYGFGTAVIVT